MQINKENNKSIGQYQRKFFTFTKKIHDLQRTVLNLKQDKEEQINLHNNSKELIKKKDEEIRSYEKQIRSKDSQIQSLNLAFREALTNYKLLLDQNQLVRKPYQVNQKLSNQSKLIHEYISNTKLKFQQMQIKKLEGVISERTQFIKNVLKQNQKLKSQILKNTAHYNQQIHKLKKQIQISNTQIEEESYQNSLFYPDNEVEDPIIKQYYQYLLSLKTDQVQTLKAERNRYSQQNTKLLVQLNQIKEELEYKKGFEFDNLFSPVKIFIENEKLKKSNQKYKKEFEFIDRHLPTIQNYKEKIKQLVNSNENILKMQQKILNLTKILQNQKKISDQTIATLRQQNKFLKQSQFLLRVKIEKYQIIINKFNNAFIKMNPFFEIYRYDLGQINNQQEQLIDKIQFKQRQTIIKQKMKLESDKNKFYFLQNQKNKQKLEYEKKIQDLTMKNKNLQSLLSSKMLQKRQFIKQSNNNLQKKSIKVIKDFNQKINQLRAKIRELQNKQQRLKSQIRLKEYGNDSQNKYQQIRIQYIPEIKLDTIVVNCPIYKENQINIVQQLNKIEKQFKTLNQSIVYVENMTKEYDRVNKSKDLLIQLRRQNVKLQFEKADLLRQLKQKIRLIQQMKMSNQTNQIPNPVILAQQKSSIGHIPYEQFEQKDTVSKQSMKRLMQVLQTHESFMEKLWCSFKTLKQYYEQVLEKLKVSEEEPSQQLESQNINLKKKIQQIEQLLKNKNQSYQDKQQQVNLLKEENERLNKLIQNKVKQFTIFQQINSKKSYELEQEIQTLKNSNSIVLHSTTNDQQTSESSDKVISTLFELVRQKNNIINDLEKQISELVRNQIRTSDQSQSLNFTAQQQNEIKKLLYEENIGDILDKAVKIIQSLKS